MSLLAKLDIFPKVDSKCLKKTTAGGITTILVYGLIFFLFFWEISQYIQTPPYNEFEVDSSIAQFMMVSIDISIATECQGDNFS